MNSMLFRHYVQEMKALIRKKGVTLTSGERFDFDLRGVFKEREERNLLGELTRLAFRKVDKKKEKVIVNPDAIE